VLVLVCHDEVVVECDEGITEKTEAWLRKALIDVMDEVLDGPKTEGPRADLAIDPLHISVRPVAGK
jgi:hypothetical protein